MNKGKKWTNRRIRLTGICILGFFLLSGWIFATVEIRTGNGEPLINLDELLVGSELGQPGSENSGSLTDPAEGESEQENKIQISVRDKSVFYKGKTYEYDKEKDCAEGFEEILRELAGHQVILQDDYAEAHAYRYVLEKIKTVIRDDSRIVQTTADSHEEGGAYEK